MARPLSEDKRNAILRAAVKLIAEQGLATSTAKIAREAGIAEGSLFTYFASKDVLLNVLYLHLKADLRSVMTHSGPGQSGLREHLQDVWQSYVNWGVAYPDKRKALARLAVSDQLTDASRAAGMEGFGDIDAALRRHIAKGVLRDQSATFIQALMGALAETTMDFMSREPKKAKRYSEWGFEAFWNAIAKA